MTGDFDHPLPYPQNRSSSLCNCETEAKRFTGINLEMHDPVLQVEYTDMETEGSFICRRKSLLLRTVNSAF